MKKNRRKFKIGDLFYNDRFVMIFSVLVAMIFWVAVSSTPSETEDSTVPINDININIVLSDDAKSAGYQVFWQSADKASVGVTANQVVLSTLSGSDILAQVKMANTITAPGTYTYPVTVRKKNAAMSFTINESTLDPQSVSFLVDRYGEKELEIEDGVDITKVDPEYMSLPASFTPKSVKISGPETNVSQVARVVGKASIAETLTESRTVTVELVLLDKDGKQLSEEDTKYLTVDAAEVQAEVVVLKRKVVPVTLEYLNKPSGFNVEDLITIEPAQLEIAATQEILDSITEIELEPLDFSKLKLSDGVVRRSIVLPSGCRNLNNIDDATITLDLTGFSARTIAVPLDTGVSFSNLPANKTAASLTASVNVTVIGPSDQLEALTKDNLQAEIDLKDRAAFTGHTELPVSFSVKGATSCWVYDEGYKASVSIADKTT